VGGEREREREKGMGDKLTRQVKESRVVSKGRSDTNCMTMPQEKTHKTEVEREKGAKRGKRDSHQNRQTDRQIYKQKDRITSSNERIFILKKKSDRLYCKAQFHLPDAIAIFIQISQLCRQFNTKFRLEFRV
jgi:hypothetical protein